MPEVIIKFDRVSFAANDPSLVTYQYIDDDQGADTLVTLKEEGSIVIALVTMNPIYINGKRYEPTVKGNVLAINLDETGLQYESPIDGYQSAVIITNIPGVRKFHINPSLN